MIKTNLIILIFLVAGNANAAEWVSKWFDGPAPAKYENIIGGVTRTYVNMPGQGGHVEWTLNTSAPTKTGGSYFSGATSGANAAAAAKLSIPYGYAAGGAAISGLTMTAAVLKPSLAKAVTYMVRVNPYVATALTFGWLANAGYQYFSNTDTFKQSIPTLTSSSGYNSCNTAPAYYPTMGFYTWFMAPDTQHYTVCPSPSVSVASGCNIGGLYYITKCYTPSAGPPEGTLVTPSQVEIGLAEKPMSISGDTDIVKAGIMDELIKAKVFPDNESPILTGPASTSGGTTTTISPNGDITTEVTNWNHTYQDNHVDTTGDTTITVTPPSGPPVITHITKPPGSPTPTPTQPAEPSKTDCDKYPTHIGCSEYGTVPVAETIPVINVPATMMIGEYSSGTCPAPKTIALSSGDYILSYQPLCDLATGTKPLFIALAYLVAGYIVLGSVRGVS